MGRTLLGLKYFGLVMASVIPWILLAEILDFPRIIIRIVMIAIIMVIAFGYYLPRRKAMSP